MSVRATFDSLLAPAGPGTDDGRLVQLWSLLPRELAAVLRPGVADVTDEILREIREAIPEYAAPDPGPCGARVSDVIQQAVLRFLDRLEGRESSRDERGQIFRDLGRREMRLGRSVDTLQAAYRVGARVAWRRMSAVGTAAGVSASTLCLLAEAVFAYIDELSALSVHGHATAQASAAGARQRRRRALMSLLLSHPPAPAHSIAELAAAAQWTAPEHVVAIALEPLADLHETPAPPVADDVLVDLEGDAPCLLLPGSARPVAALPGWRAAAGPRVPLAEAARSLRRARQTLRLVRTGLLPDTPVTRADDHLFDLWLAGAPLLVAELAKRVLAPLDNLTGKQRDRFADTLLAWLETRGNVREVAERLSIHPQTVRSRAQELDALFGASLTDPDRRFEMVLALRATRALARAEDPE
ncbi:PucR family transcriptional regulator [Amycolatopsis anabasis]|uniref:PucR family transcriptional regulator n=1 Tax=Amycolatopsis anabasis TaxID=1840409 RepID=UPI00131D7279|nr:helix-turn-helix domain-containing protein [Amycolatopsis anabasis]